MQNPRYANDSGAVLLDQADGVSIYVDSGELLVRAIAGEFGPVTAWVPPPRTIADARIEKLAELASFRYVRETTGVTVGVTTVKTDRVSQASLNAAYTALKNGLLSTVDWKAAGGVWVTLGLVEIEPIAAAVAAHVQACFTAEKTHAAAIGALATIEAVDAYNIGAGWPV